MCIFCDKWRSVDVDDYMIADVEKCTNLQRKRCTIVTGFLGAGKTTFLNYVLSANHGKKIGVLINEFGEVTIDDKLLKNKSKSMLPTENMQVVSMQNGCVCCTVRGDLVEALEQFGKTDANDSGGSAELDMDCLILECSGMSEIVPVVQTFFEPAVQRHFVLDSVVCVVDALNYFRDVVQPSMILCEEIIDDAESDSSIATVDNNRLFDSKVGKTVMPEGGNGQRLEIEDSRATRARLVIEQLGLADMVLLNKIDLVSKSQRDCVLKDVRGKNDALDIIPCRNGKVSLDQVLGTKKFSLDDAESRTNFLGRNSLGRTAPSNIKTVSTKTASKTLFPGSRDHIMKPGSVMSISLSENREPLDLGRFRSWFSDLFMRYSSQKILRCKGILDVQDGPFIRYKLQIQGVAEHVDWDMIKSEEINNDSRSTVKNYSQDETEGSRLVLIFQNPRGIDSESIRARFADCRYSIAKAMRDNITPAEKAAGSAFW